MTRWFRGTEILILAVGIALRLVRFLQQRPLWLDEALIALNVSTRTPLGLLRPLDSQQMSPLGFLWAEWMVTRLAGFGEKAFRFIPLVAAIMALIAFARLAKRLLPAGMALLATALAALSPLLIYYSAEVKSYGFDWLAAVMLMHATLNVADGESGVAWMHWALAAAFAAMFSTAAPFIVGACALALLTVPHVRRPRPMLRLTAASAIAATIFGIHLLTVYHSSSTTSFMQLYWGDMFLEPRVSAALSHLVRLAREFWSEVLFDGIVESLPRKTMAVVLVLSAVGAVAVTRKSALMVVMLLAPAVLAGVASLVELWPLTPRLLLFAAPAVLVTLPAGLFAIGQIVPAKARLPVLAVPSLAIIAFAAYGLRHEWNASLRFAALPDALRLISGRARQDRTVSVYLSSDLEAPCIYYLAWHPDRAALGGEPSTRDCTIRGARTMIGRWPQYVGVTPGAATSGAEVVRPEWLDEESRRMLREPGAELWVVLGYNPSLRNSLPQSLETSGATRVSERDLRTAVVLTYRPPPNQSR